MTSHDWLAFAREHRADLRYLVRSYHPSSDGPRGPVLLITAPDAEAGAQLARQAIAQEVEYPVAIFDKAIGVGQIDILYSILSQTWYGIPESLDAHRLIGFSTLCDLLDDPPEEEA